MSEDHPDQPAIIVAFLNELLDDKDRGVARELKEYQQRYPGYESEVAREYARLLSKTPLTVVAGAPDTTELEEDSLIRGPVAERYREEGELARGGMGTIYRVWDPTLRRELAKKVLGTGRAIRGSVTALMQRFLGEAHITAQLEHPGIVPVHELGLDADGRVYFTMSLVRGRDFAEIIDLVRDRRDGWTRTRALGVLQRVCEAVSFAHSKGVIHRDLKPANIMVGQFGETYVLDWGLARVGPMTSDAGSEDGVVGEDPAWPHLTSEGDVVGTPAYMAPEQARGNLDSIGPRTDVYAIGAMLYHLLAGRSPYADVGSTTWREMLAAKLSGPPTSLRAVARDTPEELIAIQEQATARDPEQRYESVQDLGEDLRAFLETRVVHAHRTGAIAELHKWIKRNRLAAAAAALAFVSLVAGLGTSLWLKATTDQAKDAAELQLQIRQAVLDFLNRDLLAAVSPGEVGMDASMRDVLDAASSKIDGRFPDQPLVEAAVRATLGNTYRRLGAMAEAEGHFRRSIELHQANTARDSPATLDARHGLAIVYSKQNRLRDAEREDREILAISRAAFGPEHEDTLTAANNLGLVLNNLGERDEAGLLLREVFEVRRRRLGVDHDRTLATMCNLGLLYYDSGRFKDAEPLIKGELDLCIAKHGENDPGTLISMNNYANLLSAMGREEEALVEHARAIRISAQVQGEEHPGTIESILNHAKVLKKLGHADAYREQLANASSRFDSLGPDHRARLMHATLEAGVLFTAGDFDAALAELDQLLPWCRRVLGDRARNTLEVYQLRAEVLGATDRAEEAVSELEKALAACGDDESESVSGVRIALAKLLAGLGQFSKADSELLLAERFFAMSASTEPELFFEVVEVLAAGYEQSGQAKKAADWRARIR